MGSPRAPREPATTTKGSARTATAKKTGSANVQAKRPRSKSVTKSSSKSASPPETNGDHRAPGSEADAIGAVRREARSCTFEMT